MREKTIALSIALFLAIIEVSLGQGQASRPISSPEASLRFTAQNGDLCEATVRDQVAPSEKRRFTISCDSKMIFSYITPDHLLDISRDSFDGTRLFARWEGTTLVHLTIFHLEINQISSKVDTVFDQSGEFFPDIPSPDVILLQKDKRFVGADIVPTRTDVYGWNGSKYELKSSWKWNEGMRYEDRFCVLDVKALSCPVTPIPLK
jgi:hypothetical protein